MGKDAAVMVADKDAEQQLVPKALEIIHDDERLRVLGRNIATLAQHQSAERIVDEIVKIMPEKLWPLVKKVIVFYKKSYSLF